MTATVYSTHDFDYNKALDGALCIITNQGSNDEVSSDNTSEFIGAGIVRKDNPNRLVLTVKGVPYYFKNNGDIIDTTLSSFHLKLATITDPTAVGPAIEGVTVTNVTRGDDGTVTPASVSTENSVVVSDLNPRDQFAVQALQSMMTKIPDPSILSSAEMDLYCKAAYLWASNMMKNAANARATVFVDGGAPATGTATISSLDNNTERLLNNLIQEIAKINTASGMGLWSKTGQTSVEGEHTDAWVAAHPLGGTTYQTVAAAEAAGWSWTAYAERVEVQSMPSLAGTINIGDSGLGRDASHPINDLVHIGSSTNGRGESSSYPFVVKGGDTYTPTGGTAINDVVKVAIVAGGGGGSASVDKSSVPTVQPSLTYTLEHVLVFQYDTYSTSLRKVALGDLGVPVLQTISNGNFPSYSDIQKGYYYKFITTNPTVVDIDLPAAAVPNGDIVNIVIFSFTLSATANFSVTAQNNNDIWYRESNPGATLAAGTYEINCLADGNRWIIGVTKLVQ